MADIEGENYPEMWVPPINQSISNSILYVSHCLLPKINQRKLRRLYREKCCVYQSYYTAQLSMNSLQYKI